MNVRGTTKHGATWSNGATRLLLLCAAVVCVVGTLRQEIGHAQLLQFPPLVRFIGSFVDISDEAKRESNALFTVIDNTERIFLVTSAEVLSSNYRDLPILSRLFPKQIRIIGKDELIGKLRQAGTLKKLMFLEGYLYIESRHFLLANVQLSE
jgi:hypothetical protein